MDDVMRWLVMRCEQVEVTAWQDEEPTYVWGSPDRVKIKSGFTAREAIRGEDPGRVLVMPVPDGPSVDVVYTVQRFDIEVQAVEV